MDAFINVEEELKKLEADLAHQQGFLRGVMAKLSNERFVQNAKPEIVALEQKKKADAESRIEALRRGYQSAERLVDWIDELKNEGNIEVIGARVHNLKNISVSIPRKRLTVITGLSGSGKSSLAFDTIFAEGQRRYMETFSSYARGFIGQMQRPDVDKITGLSPVISIDQKTTSKNPRSTVGTITEVYDFLRLLFARAATPYSYLSGKPMVNYTDEQIMDLIVREYAGKKILLLAPLVRGRKGHYKELFETIRKKGFVHVRVDGEVQEIVPGMKLDRYKMHSIEVVVDRLKVKSESLQGERRKTPTCGSR